MNTLEEFLQAILSMGTVQKSEKSTVYARAYLTFDIETTRLPNTDISVMYTWQISSNAKVNGEYPVYIGRTWEEYQSFTTEVQKLMESMKARIVIFVHNLNYEMIYLNSFYKFTDCLWLSPWNILSFNTNDGFIQYRDSYRLFNNSLKSVTKGLPHEKRNGEDFDYTKPRYNWTELTNEELGYCTNDVVGLVEAIEKRFIEFGLDGNIDTIATVPLTSTGYVRREISVKRPKTKKGLQGLELSDKTYELLRVAFRGGNTHSNRKYTGKVLHNVVSYDRSSSYPDVLVNDKFPVTEFIDSDFYEDDSENAYLLKIKYNGIVLKEGVTVPYIPTSKCEALEYSQYNDNGRVVVARTLTTVITDIDYRIIKSQYNYSSYEILECMRSEYGYLPKWYTETINKYYTNKTSLKGVKGCEVEYAKSKELLNSIYGMSVTDPRKMELFLDFDTDMFGSRIPDKFQKAILPYQWGVWCTARARERLQYGIDICKEAFVYCDTDSIKAIQDKLPPDFKDKLDAFNNTSIKNSTMHGGVATTPKGVTKYMGVFEYEETYTEFRTWGAKKYCYRDDDGLHITVSGVSKNCTRQLEDDIANFDIGLIFCNCKLTPKRTFTHGKHKEVSVTDYLGISGNVIVTDCNTLVDTDYSLGLDETYEFYIKEEK